MNTDPEFDRLVAEALAAPFSGWDFSWLEGRRIEEGEDRLHLQIKREGGFTIQGHQRLLERRKPPALTDPPR